MAPGRVHRHGCGGRKTATVAARGPDWPVTGIPESLPGTVTTNVTRTAYDAWGRIASTTDALGQTTDHAYDNLGRKVGRSCNGKNGPCPGFRPGERRAAVSAVRQGLTRPAAEKFPAENILLLPGKTRPLEPLRRREPGPSLDRAWPRAWPQPGSPRPAPVCP